MKNIFFTLLIITSIIFITDGCNNNDQKAIPTPVVSIDSLSKKPITVPAEDEDYTKRNINVAVGDMAQIKKDGHLTDKGVTGNADAVTGDFNGDGKSETLYLIAPTADTSAFEQCYGGACNSYIVSSDASMPVLKVHDNLGEQIKVIDDMDDDGGNELIVYPSWWQSNWNPYRVYSFNKVTGKWSFLTEPVSIFANVLYDNKRIVLVKRSTKKGFVTAYTSESNDNGVTSAYKDIKIIK